MRWKRTELAYLVCIHPFVAVRWAASLQTGVGCPSVQWRMGHLQAECAEMLGVAA